jgi:hypothetical protein
VKKRNKPFNSTDIINPAKFKKINIKVTEENYSYLKPVFESSNKVSLLIAFFHIWILKDSNPDSIYLKKNRLKTAVIKTKDLVIDLNSKQVRFDIVSRFFLEIQTSENGQKTITCEPFLAMIRSICRNSAFLDDLKNIYPIFPNELQLEDFKQNKSLEFRGSPATSKTLIKQPMNNLEKFILKHINYSKGEYIEIGSSKTRNQQTFYSSYKHYLLKTMPNFASEVTKEELKISINKFFLENCEKFPDCKVSKPRTLSKNRSDKLINAAWSKKEHDELWS